jgi:hypothetical protein
MVNGHVYPQVDSIGMDARYREPKFLFLNQHDGKFINSSKLLAPPFNNCKSAAEWPWDTCLTTEN